MKARALTLLSLLAATPVALIGQQGAGTPMAIPLGPACTQDTLEAWARLDAEQQGAEVFHPTRHEAPRISAARQIYWGPFTRSDNYMALTVENQTLCGRVVKDQRFYNDGLLRLVRWVPERDWNFYIEPDPAFRGLTGMPWPPPHECSRERDRADDKCVETEVTPHPDLRAFLDPLALLEGRGVCVYGVYVYDAGHDGGKPEIHPALAVWLDTAGPAGVRQRRVYVVQDGSRRFDKESYFTSPPPPPWAGSPLEIVYRAAVRIPARDRIHIDVSSPAGRGLTVTNDRRAASRRAIVYDGRDVGVLTVSNGFERFASIELRDVCADGDEGVGYLEIATAVVGAEIGNPGYAVIDVVTRFASTPVVRPSPHPSGPAPRGRLSVVPGSVVPTAAGMVADFVLEGPLAESTPRLDVGAGDGPRPALVDVPTASGERVRLVTGVPISQPGSAAGGVQDPLASLDFDGESLTFPRVGLRVTAHSALPELGEPDPAAWGAFLEEAGVGDPGEAPGLVLHRVRRWLLETAGGFLPVTVDETQADPGWDLAYEVNRARADFLNRAGWAGEWRTPAPDEIGGARLAFDSTGIVFDLSAADGSNVWNLAQHLPGLDEASGEVASHLIALPEGDASGVLGLLNGPTLDLTQLDADASANATAARFVRSRIEESETRAIALGHVLRRFAADGTITLGELRSLRRLVGWWRESRVISD